MKIKLSHLSAVALATAALVVSGAAQSDALRAAAGDKYVISARAGGVNFVEGNVGVVRLRGKSGLLVKGDKLEIGDRVSTGDTGRAEILLNPGSYLRLGSNSAFEFKTTALDDLQLIVGRGSAIFEVFADDEFKVTVRTPATGYELVQSGVYRVDVPENGPASLEVWKGKAVANGTELKGGKVATGSGASMAVAKFDRDEKDALELWSKDRAKQLAKITNSLQGRDLRTALMQSFLGRRWNVYNSFGLWVYDPFSFSYCFLPFGYGWTSPYGYGFGRDLGWYNLPSVVYYPQPSANPGTGPSQTGSSIASQGDRSPTPPFVRMQGTSGVFGRGNGDTTRGGSYEPSSIGSPAIPAPVSAPAPEPSSGSGRSKKP